MLSVFAKVPERIINKRLVSFLNSNKIIVKKQFGFQKNKSPEIALRGIKEQILENIERKTCTTRIFLDFKRAFDCVQHNTLLRKLPLWALKLIENLSHF